MYNQIKVNEFLVYELRPLKDVGNYDIMYFLSEHSSLEEAKIEKDRLTKLNNKEYYVCENKWNWKYSENKELYK